MNHHLSNTELMMIIPLTLACWMVSFAMVCIIIYFKNCLGICTDFFDIQFTVMYWFSIFGSRIALINVELPLLAERRH